MLGLLLLASAHCAEVASTPPDRTDAGSDAAVDGSGLGDAAPRLPLEGGRDGADGPPGPAPTVCSGRVPMSHRAQPGPACPASTPFSDASIDCTTDADCADSGVVPTGTVRRYVASCLHGKCSPDQCLTDGDCPTTAVCVCGGGANSCYVGNCRTDADCAPGKYCSPSETSGPFYGVEGYYCHTCADVCTDDNDCNNPCFGQNWCAYDPTVGSWACGTVCAAG